MRRIGVLLAAGAAGVGGAQTLAPVPGPVSVAASPPAHVSVTLYRNPYRYRGQSLDLAYLGGFALVTETRTVRLPAGRAVLRFEGVAGGIVPVSALVSGLPGKTIEKNRDARLLSPAALVDGTLGRHVTLRRTDRRSGKVREEDATIVSGPQGGVVVRTREGVEALGCAGLAEKPLYPRVPAGLTAKPTLSVLTNSPAPRTARITLSYLASDFDWAASYVASVAPDGRTLDLFAWMTLANGNAESFAHADVLAVAGRLNSGIMRDYWRAAGELRLDCYPLGTTTSDLPDPTQAEDIVVTASRRMAFAPPAPPAPAPIMAPPPENLGDLKLYRVPFATDIAASAQKQVALLSRQRVPFERIYRASLAGTTPRVSLPTQIVLRMANTRAAGLGLALPAGTAALYGTRGGDKVLAGTGDVADTAVGERIELRAGMSDQVRVARRIDRQRRATVTLSNANPVPVTVEVTIGGAGDRALTEPDRTLLRIDGAETWRETVPANGSVALNYGPRD